MPSSEEPKSEKARGRTVKKQFNVAPLVTSLRIIYCINFSGHLSFTGVKTCFFLPTFFSKLIDKHVRKAKKYSREVSVNILMPINPLGLFVAKLNLSKVI